MKHFIASLFAASVGLSCTAVADESDWDSLVEVSYEYLYAQQEILEQEFDLSKHERWDFDQGTGRLVFSNDGKPAVAADVQLIGSFSTAGNTWLWGWANPSVDKNLTSSIESVRRHGQEQGFEKLIESKWDGDEIDGWEMAAVTTYILKGDGVYRAPSNDLHIFMLMTNVVLVE